MMQKLDEAKLVIYEKYRGFTLTDKGKRLAKKLVERHKMLEEFLEIIGVQDENIYKEVEKLEHYISKETALCISNLLDFFEENPSIKNLSKQWKNQYPLFVNNQNNKLTKEGVAYILNKYVTMAKPLSRSIPDHVSPHMFRHSKAMHLLQAGVNLIYIRDFIGHVDNIKTT
jgi:Mn-dependent DtxR family transcriptional regulator